MIPTAGGIASIRLLAGRRNRDFVDTEVKNSGAFPEAKRFPFPLRHARRAKASPATY